MLSHQEKQLAKTIQDLEETIKLAEENEHLFGYEPRSDHYPFLMQKEKVRAFIGSNQSGKTVSVCMYIACTCLGYHTWIKSFISKIRGETRWNSPYYKSKHITKDIFPWNLDLDKLASLEALSTPPVRVLIAGLDFQSAVSKVICPKLLEIVPKRYIRNIQMRQGKVPEIIHFENGSEVHFFSCEQDTFRFEGGTWDLAVFDEPPPQDKWIATKRGLMVKEGVALFSMTPLAEPWIFDDLVIESKKEGSKIFMTNCDLYNPEIDWMSLEAKKDFEDSIYRMNPHEVEARVHGKFTHMMGRVIANYDEDIHFVDSEFRPTPNQDPRAGGGTLSVTLGCTVDPHDRRPWAVAWWWVDQDGEIVFFREWPNDPYTELKSSDHSVAQYADEIKRIELEIKRETGALVKYRFLDPNAGPKINGVTRRRLVDELALENLYFDVKINDALDEGHDAIRDYLQYNKDKKIQPRLYIRQECWNINHSILRYVWQEKKPDQALSVKPQEKHKDFVDVVRYTVIKKPIYLDGDMTGPHGPNPRDMWR